MPCGRDSIQQQRCDLFWTWSDPIALSVVENMPSSTRSPWKVSLNQAHLAIASIWEVILNLLVWMVYRDEFGNVAALIWLFVGWRIGSRIYDCKLSANVAWRWGNLEWELRLECAGCRCLSSLWKSGSETSSPSTGNELQKVWHPVLCSIDPNAQVCCLLMTTPQNSGVV